MKTQKIFMEATTKKKDGHLLAIASTESEDRVGDRLKMDDWDLSRFKKNPVLQAGHDYSPQSTIGIAKNIRIEGKTLVFEPHFHTETQLARDIKAMYEHDPAILSAWSVGFIPLAMMEGEDGKPLGKNELLEVSAVAVPANADCLTMAKSYGDKEADLVIDWIQKELSDDETEEEEEDVEDEDLDETEEVEEKEAEEKAQVEVETGETNEHTHTATYDDATGDGTTNTVNEHAHSIRNFTVLEAGEVSHTHELDTKSGHKPKKKPKKPKKKPKKDIDEVENIDKTVIPYEDRGSSDIDTKWDAGAEVKVADITDLLVISAWYDPDNRDVKSAYKLPHHKGTGRHPSVWNGVKAAMGALLGARGGVDIQDNERRGVYNHLKKHYKEYDKEAPDFKEYSIDELYEMDSKGIIDIGDTVAISKELLEEITDVKVGKVISKKNEKLIRDTLDKMSQISSALEKILDADTANEAPVKAVPKETTKGREKTQKTKLKKVLSQDEIVLEALRKIASYSNKALNSKNKKK